MKELLKNFIALVAAITMSVIIVSCKNAKDEPANNNDGSTTTSHECVDMGLSVKWATCNIGAERPSEFGNYFAWGETTPKTKFSDNNCSTLGKLIGDISGDATYDAAKAKWGGNWRMPTADECQELLDNCTFTMKTQNGVNGVNVKSQINGNTIFLPLAGGYLLGDDDGTSPYAVGEHVIYWSSTPCKNESVVEYSDEELAYGFSPSEVAVGVFGLKRSSGIPIRAVCE